MPGQLWTDREDRLVIEAARLNYELGPLKGDARLREVAGRIGRTYAAVLHRTSTLKARSNPGNGRRPRNRWHGGRQDVHKWTAAQDAELVALPGERGKRSGPTALARFAARIGVSVEAARTRRNRLRRGRR